MRRQILIAIAAAVAVVLLFTLLLIKPKLGQIKEVNDKIETAEGRETDLRLSLRQLEQARRDAPATQAELAKFQLLLPPTPDLPTFIRQLQAAANADGIDLQSIAPSPPTSLGGGPGAKGPQEVVGVQTINVNLQVLAGFFRLESFLARLEDLQRVVEVRSISISPQVDEVTGETVLQSTITLTMYVAEPGARVAAPRATPTAKATSSSGLEG